jgi:hypothetical protein
MLPTKYLLNHIDALMRLSHDVSDRAASAKLREMADEFRIMVSVADVTGFAAALNENTAPPPIPDLTGTAAVPDAPTPKPKRKPRKRPVK